MEERRRIAITRVIPIPVEQVFLAWKEPDALKCWAWGSIGRDCQAEVDFRVGGAFSVSTLRPNGERWRFSGIYTTITENQQIVHSLEWDAPMGYEDASETVGVTFTPEAGGTRVDFIHEGNFSEKSREVHEEGWKNVLSTLEEYLIDQIGVSSS